MTKYNFVVDIFEQKILDDLGLDNKMLLRKLKRNLTSETIEWIKQKVDQKEPVMVNLKGGTRTGKSLGGLMIAYLIVRQYPDKEFDAKKIVCANQGEYMTKLHKVEFGDVLQMDEKLFGEVGEGSYALEHQLVNTGNVTAKYNIHTITITPKRFVSNNASIGLVTWGRDKENWLSRYILYDLRGSIPVLLGHVIVDIKPLFEDFGCKVYKKCGGCPNPKSYTAKLDTLKKECHRDITPQEEKKIIYDGRSCPFYNFCELPMSQYEHKKDDWIDDELKGGLSFRKKEIIKCALLVMPYVCVYDKDGTLKFNVKNKAQCKEITKLYLEKVSNIKPTIQEFDSIMTNLDIAVTRSELLEVLCEKADLNHKEILDNIPLKE